MVTNACDCLGDALGVLGDRKPVDVLRFGRAATCADVGKPLGAELGGLEAVPEQAADDVVCEELHAAVRVVYHEPLRGTEQLVGDDERADRVIAGAAAGVADDVRVTLAETGVPRRVESCVHAGEDGEAPRWRKGEIRLRAEACGVLIVGCENLAADAHGRSFSWPKIGCKCRSIVRYQERGVSVRWCPVDDPANLPNLTVVDVLATTGPRDGVSSRRLIAAPNMSRQSHGAARARWAPRPG